MSDEGLANEDNARPERRDEKFLAVHEAGHAVAAWKLRIEFSAIQIEDDLRNGWILMSRYSPPGPWKDLDAIERGFYRRHTERYVIALLAGTEATGTAELTPPRNADNSFDWKEVEELVWWYSPTSRDYYCNLNKLIQKCKLLMRDRKVQKAVEAVSQELIRKRHLSYDEVAALIRLASPKLRRQGSSPAGLPVFREIIGKDGESYFVSRKMAAAAAKRAVEAYETRAKRPIDAPGNAVAPATAA